MHGRMAQRRELALKGERMSMRDLAHRTLRDACIRGLLAPGEMLSEEQLAATLNVSRTPLREALQRLHAEGLVERAGNGRIYVREASREEARHLYAVRAELERLAVREAARRMTPQILARLRSALEAMQRAEKTRTVDVADSGEHFHAILYEAAANPINQHLLENLKALIDRYRYISTANQRANRRHEAVREHEAIFAALAAGDIEAADEAMRTHMERGLHSVLASLPND